MRVSCPLRKGSFEGHCCSVLFARGLGKRTEEQGCGAAKITYLPVVGNELLSAGVHDPPLCRLGNLCKSVVPYCSGLHTCPISLRLCAKSTFVSIGFFSWGSHAAVTSKGLLREGKNSRLCLEGVRD